MDIKKIVLISLIVVAIVASVSAVSAGWFDGLFGDQHKDNVVEVDGITFNTTNATELELINKTEHQAYSSWHVIKKQYADKNGSGYNVWIYNFSGGSNWNSAVEWHKTNGYEKKPSQTVNGVVIYTISAKRGPNIGQPRFQAIVENADLKSIVEIVSPDPNETAKMVLSLKFK